MWADGGTSEAHVPRSRYFFSIRHRDRLMPDREGIELDDRADMDRCARFLASRLQGDEALVELNLEGCAIEVTDERGTLLHTVFLDKRRSVA